MGLPKTRFDYDVIVLGGGPAGAAIAVALSRAGLSIAIVTKPEADAPRIGETVPPEIIRPLVRLGLWDHFVAAAHHAAPGTVVIWGDETPYETDFLFNPYGSGWHLDRDNFDAMLLAGARAAGAEIVQSSPVDCVSGSDQEWNVLIKTDSGHRTFATRWVIDASGRAAWLSRRLGAKRNRLDNLIALVRFASTASVKEPRTLIESSSNGWWYSAPLPNNRIVAAFFTDSDLVPRGTQARAEFWDQMLTQTSLLASVFPSHSRSGIRIVTACSGRFFPCAGRNWLSIGDAAQFQDPLSGQGITRALTSALYGAETVLTGLRENGAVDEFLKAADRDYERYMATRLTYYRRERRWPQHPFWQRRLALSHP